MTKILAIYYSQTGQLKSILNSIISPFVNDESYEIKFLELKPEKTYPFPWGKEFYDCFPESVNGIPCNMATYDINSDEEFDLILFAHQPWYLSPSIPIWSFLNSKTAAKLFKDKPVITIIGARNMWVSAQELIKKQLHKLNANLIGNIVLHDRADNIIAGFTIIKWLINGKKGPFRILPEAGVSKNDIEGASRFGKIIKEQISNNQLTDLQDKLMRNKAVKVKFHLLNMEIAARKIFCKFANLALKKGETSERKRQRIVKLFKAYLIFALFIISPFASFVFMMVRILLFPIANRRIKYYSGVNLEK